MAHANFTIITPTRLTGVSHPVIGRKTELPPNPFGSAAIPAHATATAMHFPANAGLIFLTDELINDRYLIEKWEKRSINRNVHCSVVECEE
jgi:hypothetical protein